MADRQTPLNANDPPEQTKPDQVNQRQQEQAAPGRRNGSTGSPPFGRAKATLSQLTIKRPEWTAIEFDSLAPQAGRKVKAETQEGRDVTIVCFV